MTESAISDTRLQQATAHCVDALDSHGPVVDARWMGWPNRYGRTARLQMEDGTRFVLKLPSSWEPVRCFRVELAMSNLLTDAGCRVPRVVFSNEEQGILLLEYVGDHTLDERCESLPAEEQGRILGRAVGLLAGMERAMDSRRGDLVALHKSLYGGDYKLELEASYLAAKADSLCTGVAADILNLAGVSADDVRAVRLRALVPELAKSVPGQQYIGPLDVWPPNTVVDEHDGIWFVDFERLSPTCREWRFLCLVTGIDATAGVGVPPFPRTALAKEYYAERGLQVDEESWARQLDAQLFWKYWNETGRHLAWCLRKRDEYSGSWSEFVMGKAEDRYAQMVRNYLDSGSFSDSADIHEFRSLVSELLGEWIENTVPHIHLARGGVQQIYRERSLAWEKLQEQRPKN